MTDDTTTTMTGRELAEPGAAARLGVVASETLQARTDVILRHIGEAIADYVIPEHGLKRIVQAAALIALMFDTSAVAGRPATAILEDAERRWHDGTIEPGRARLAALVGEERAVEFLDELRLVGRAVYTALEDCPIPDEAANLLAVAVADVADHKTGARQ